MRIRSQVSVFGRLKAVPPSPAWVEVLIDHFGELAPEPADLYEIVDAGTHDSLQTTECLQQFASFDGPQSWDGFENRLAVTLCPLAPVPRDRKPVRLVAHSLDQ